jgi:hypothetical protein
MLIKITDFNDLYSKSGFDKNETKTYMLAHAGCEFYNICYFLQKAYKLDSFLFKPSVHLSLMHQCIELLVKALATKVDDKTAPKNLSKTHLQKKTHGHETIAIVEKYQHQISIFSSILLHPEKKELIIELEKAYKMVRYAEAHVYSETKIFELFNSIAEELILAYNDLHGRILTLYEPSILLTKITN